MWRKSRLIEDESGQALVMVTILMTTLLGFSALVVDVGYMYVQKSTLQNAADAAALAGALAIQEDETEILKNVTSYLDDNIEGAYSFDPDEDLNIDDFEKTVWVHVEQDSPQFFARILSPETTTIPAEAKAKYVDEWNGEVLPFLNTQSGYLNSGTQIDVWEKVGSGYFESIENYEMINNVSPFDNIYFNIDLEKGVQIKNGEVADKKQEIGYYYNLHKPYVYILSFSPKAINTQQVTLTDGSQVSISNLKNKKSFVASSSLVLVKCTFDAYDIKKKTLKLTSVATYDFGNDDNDYPLPDYPTDYVSPDGGSANLIE